MQNKSALLLSLTAAAAAAALSGCVSTGPVDPERAAKHTPEYQYQPKLSRANNLATEFGVKHIMDRPAPKDVKLTSDGSMLLDGAVWGALHGNVAGSGILSGTADWNIGFGLWLAQSLLLPSTDPTPDCLVGYVRAEEAQDRKAAVNAFVAKAIPAIAESLKKQDQFKDYQISYHIDEKGTGNNDAGIEVVNEELGCKRWKDTLLGVGQCGIEIVNFGLWTFAPQISTPRFTDPQIQVWYIQGKDVQLKFRDAVLKPKFDWAKTMIAAAPDLPEYVYAYINTRKGPAPEKALNPPFFVEKDRVNFFIIPKNDKTEEPSSEEEKKPLQEQTQTTAAK